ncbi:MAG TPA: imidazolonepropionase [Gemmatimonadota bacterium]|nr:imidazolonepropionase [Gemmatimonadota bacterium]
MTEAAGTRAPGGGELLVHGLAQLVDPRGPTSAPLTILEDAFVWVRGGQVAAAGAMADLPSEAARLLGDGGDPRAFDGTGCVALPGLVDSHTHAVFGRAREHEFERRLAGSTYAEIAAAGGGILFSVLDLRARGEDELVEISRPRIAEFARFGVTTVEVKSGYGLTVEDELKTLRAVRRLSQDQALPRLVPTFLGAHAVPGEHAADRESYVRLVIDEMLPAVVAEHLAEFCDVFCEEGAFTLAESERILERAGDLGLGLKIHAEEFTPLGGAELAARLGATSADHLVAIDERGIAALGASTTVATLLPGTSLFLKLGRHAPGRALADAGATLAVATDFNPGSSMSQNLPLMVPLACLNLGLTIPEAVRAVTRGGALALGRPELGTFDVGAAGDVAVFDTPDVRHLAYNYGVPRAVLVARDGNVLRRAARQSTRHPTALLS